MRNYCKILCILLFISLSMSSCSLFEKKDTRVLRKPVNIVKYHAQSVSKRKATYYSYDIDNIQERYGIIEADNQYWGKLPSRSLKSSSTYLSKANLYEPVRSSEFKTNVDGVYSNYIVDEKQKSLMGVSYNTRDGYLKSARSTSVAGRGYIENVDKQSDVDDSEEANFTDSFPKGYIESLGLENSRSYSGKNYIEESVNGDKAILPKNYLASIGDEAKKKLNKGYIENTFISDYTNGVSQMPVSNSYLDMTLQGSLPGGYLQNVGVAGTLPKGYVEAYNVNTIYENF
jgi:hypothetical protein